MFACMHGVVFVGVCVCVVCVCVCACVRACVCDDSVRHSTVATSYLHCLSVLLPSSYIAS